MASILYVSYNTCRIGPQNYIVSFYLFPSFLPFFVNQQASRLLFSVSRSFSFSYSLRCYGSGRINRLNPLSVLCSPFLVSRSPYSLFYCCLVALCEGVSIPTMWLNKRAASAMCTGYEVPMVTCRKESPGAPSLNGRNQDFSGDISWEALVCAGCSKKKSCDWLWNLPN